MPGYDHTVPPGHFEQALARIRDIGFPIPCFYTPKNSGGFSPMFVANSLFELQTFQPFADQAEK
jgi:hypothetical protein